MRSTSVAMGRVLGLLSLFLVVSVVAGALVAGLFVPAVAAAGGATRGTITWFNDIASEVPTVPLQQQSRLYAADGKTEIARFNDENRSEVSLKQISKNMQQAIIDIEDSRFLDHGGVDPVGLLRAFASNQFGNGTEVQGGSTLTQQYIKNVFLEQANNSGDKEAQKRAVARDPKRKLLEVRAAIDLEKKYSKSEILTKYLNIAFFGNNSYGIQAAAERYFSVSALNLTVPQAAMLAGMVQSPSSFNPLSSSRVKATTARRNTVLDRMHELGHLSSSRWRAYRASKLGIKQRMPQSGCISAGSLAYFCEYVRSSIVSGADGFAALGATSKERANALNRGGLRIYTTIDLKVQDAAVKALTKRVPIGDPSKVASAAVTVEPGTGKVLAMTQNKTYDPRASLSNTTINYAVDTNVGGASGYQTGSTFKAFTLAAFLKDGNSLNDFLDASITDRPPSDFTQCGNTPLGHAAPIYHIKNSESNVKKRISVLDATAESVNTAYVDMETKVPLCDITKTAEAIGVHLAAPDNDCGGEKTTRLPACIASLTLGPLSISPLSMAEAYATFAADGTWCPATPVDSILGADGKPIAIKKTPCKDHALPDDVAHGVTYALKGPLFAQGGTAQGAWKGTTRNIAGKTGTADQSKDTWFVGYTRQRATAVWVGDTVNPLERVPRGQKIARDRRTLSGRTIGGKQYQSVFGATIAAPIWADIMKVAIIGTKTDAWDDPPASMLAGHGVPVPSVKGLSIAEATASLTAAGFQVRVGAPIDSNQPAGFVADTSPGGGESTSPGDTVTIYPSNGSGKTAPGQNAGDKKPRKKRPRPPRRA